MVSVARGNRRGSSNLGCLLWLLAFTAALYYGVHIGEIYWRYFRVVDAMKGQARMAESLTDEAIKRRLIAMTDTLDLPSAGRRFRVTRSLQRRNITITTRYSEHLELPLFERTFHFRPRVSEPL
jgi:hypothetical protein